MQGFGASLPLDFPVGPRTMGADSQASSWRFRPGQPPESPVTGDFFFLRRGRFRCRPCRGRTPVGLGTQTPLDGCPKTSGLNDQEDGAAWAAQACHLINFPRNYWHLDFEAQAAGYFGISSSKLERTLRPIKRRGASFQLELAGYCPRSGSRENRNDIPCPGGTHRPRRLRRRYTPALALIQGPGRPVSVSPRWSPPRRARVAAFCATVPLLARRRSQSPCVDLTPGGRWAQQGCVRCRAGSTGPVPPLRLAEQLRHDAWLDWHRIGGCRRVIQRLQVHTQRAPPDVGQRGISGIRTAPGVRRSGSGSGDWSAAFNAGASGWRQRLWCISSGESMLSRRALVRDHSDVVSLSAKAGTLSGGHFGRNQDIPLHFGGLPILRRIGTPLAALALDAAGSGAARLNSAIVGTITLVSVEDDGMVSGLNISLGEIDSLASIASARTP